MRAAYVLKQHRRRSWTNRIYLNSYKTHGHPLKQTTALMNPITFVRRDLCFFWQRYTYTYIYTPYARPLFAICSTTRCRLSIVFPIIIIIIIVIFSPRRLSLKRISRHEHFGDDLM